MPHKPSQRISKEKWVWMPHAGHFILGNYCRFHLTTKVGEYIVSTLGELWNDSAVRKIHAQIHDSKWHFDNAHLKGDSWDYAYMKRFGFDSLHLDDWKYETMVFKAMKNTQKEYQCCPWLIDVTKNQEEKWYKTPIEAYKGHLKMCEKYSKK